VTKYVVPVVCALVATAAVVAAVLSDDPPERRAQGTNLLYPESAGLRWFSLERSGPLKLSGSGTYWVAFRAFARGGRATLTMTGEDGTRFSVPVGPDPAIQLAGPIEVRGATTYWLAAGERGGEIFSSGHRLVRRPLGALPGSGFWAPAAGDPRDSVWLNSAGVVDVAAAGRPPAQVWLTFEATSVDRRRTLTIGMGAAQHRVDVPERGSRKRVTVGPFPTTRGRVRVRFHSRGPVIRGGDPRLRTVRISELEAHPTPRP
jgi:hypothetical protein